MIDDVPDLTRANPPVPAPAPTPAAEPTAAPSDLAARTGLPEPALAYDYFKNMVSVSLATLGGILTLAGTVFGARIAPWEMAVAALPVAASGLLALQAKTDIMQLCQGLKPPRNTARLALRLVPSLYGLGLGIFLAMLFLSYLSPPR